jgi:diguanylate cyclase (GGDEF)-like protein
LFRPGALSGSNFVRGIARASPVSTPTPNTDPSAQSSPRQRLLVADASRIVRTAITQQIRDRFDIREAVDGEAAWQAVLLDASIKLVVADLNLPKVDGLELLSRVRSSKVQRIREMPLILLGGDDDLNERQRAIQMGATDFILKSAAPGDLLSRLNVLVDLSRTREALIEAQATLESARTIDPDTELLSLPFFDKQMDKQLSFARRNLSDVAIICIRVELAMPQQQGWEGESEQRMKLVGRTLAASVRLEDFAARSGSDEFCVGTQSTGLSGVLRFAARLRKVLENVEAAGPGVEVWTSIGVSTLSEEMRRSADELRTHAQKRAAQAQQSRARRIVLGVAEGATLPSSDAQGTTAAMDVNLALALLQAGRAAEVAPHAASLHDQITPLLRLIQQQQELQQAPAEAGLQSEVTNNNGISAEGSHDDHVQGVSRPLDR